MGLGLLGGLVGLLMLWVVVNFAGGLIPEFLLAPVRDPALLDKAEAKQCGDCHKAIYEAWKESRHSRAWISKNYIKDSEDRTKEKCLPCHIPQVVRAGKKPDPRLDQRDEGIFCVSCHVKDGAMHGPHNVLSPPHPTRQNQNYNSSKLCGSCHEKTFEQWEKTGVRETCQSCHMPRTKKRLTQKPPLSWLHREQWVGDHRFLHGDFEADTLGVQVSWTDSRIVLGLKNQTVPHHVPTADNGDPRLYLETRLLEDSGKEYDNIREILAPQQETALPYNQEVTFRYRVPEKVRRASIQILYRPAWSKEKKPVWSGDFDRNSGG